MSLDVHMADETPPRRTTLLDLINPDDGLNHRNSFDNHIPITNSSNVDYVPITDANPRSTPNPISIPTLLNTVNNDNNNNDHAATSSKPASTAAKPPSSAAATTTKPRSTKPAKARSPSPSPPPPPAPPLQTIRLEINLGGPSNYEVDIGNMAKATGQRPPTPVPVKRDSSDSEGDDDDDKSKDKDKQKDKEKPKKKKKNAASEYYDITDPFIDDSELALDERTWFAQTKQQGFYVSSGEVALLKDKTPKKPKSKKVPLSLHNEAGPSNHDKRSKSEGTRDAPIALNSDDDRKGAGGGGAGRGEDGDEENDGKERIGEKRKRYITLVEGGKKRKVVDINSFHPDLQVSIENIKQAVGRENWSQKGKFPPALKPMLSQLALQAIKLDEYDEYFFNLMPSIFPYNKFTMSKLIKRTVFHEHTALLMQRQETLLEELKQEAQQGFSKAEEEWARSVVAWDKRQEKARVEAASASTPGAASGGDHGASDSAAPTRHPTEEMDVDHPAHDGDGGEGAGGGAAEGGGKGAAGKDQHQPAKKYRMTETMKAIVWQLVLLSNECCRLENEKNTLEGSVLQVSEQGLRKVLYQKIVAAFPEGWMSSGQISRDVSAMKKKLEKEALENE